MTIRMAASLLALSLVALTGCSKDAEPFEDLTTFATAVDAAGVECSDLDPGPEAQLVDDSGTCTSSGVALYLFDDGDDLEDWRKVGTRVAPALIGPNWAATGEAEQIDRLSDALGGEVTRPAG